MWANGKAPGPPPKARLMGVPAPKLGIGTAMGSPPSAPALATSAQGENGSKPSITLAGLKKGGGPAPLQAKFSLAPPSPSDSGAGPASMEPKPESGQVKIGNPLNLSLSKAAAGKPMPKVPGLVPTASLSSAQATSPAASGVHVALSKASAKGAALGGLSPEAFAAPKSSQKSIAKGAAFAAASKAAQPSPQAANFAHPLQPQQMQQSQHFWPQQPGLAQPLSSNHVEQEARAHGNAIGQSATPTLAPSAIGVNGGQKSVALESILSSDKKESQPSTTATVEEPEPSGIAMELEDFQQRILLEKLEEKKRLLQERQEQKRKEKEQEELQQARKRQREEAEEKAKRQRQQEELEQARLRRLQELQQQNMQRRAQEQMQEQMQIQQQQAIMNTMHTQRSFANQGMKGNPFTQW
eukprot:TRINITY_DN26699_c0_g1_i1.p1 TRINITY_DN26699_c0_g1~~TRINITY_DN26699_c0_g1_i1.p1  ORF type:complete len:411 (+),score=92.80 TRINITY_DN26699_c0_g1_i1:162-1394(+)